MPNQRNTAESFWSRVAKSDSCWLWQGGTNHEGYGRISFENKQRYAHQVAYLITYGAIPSGLFVLHTCDNPLCVRPNHLYLGTHQDNMNDRKNRGGYATGENHYIHKHPEIVQGERNGRAKISNQTAQEIHRRYVSEGIRQVDLAKEYNLSQAQISWIIRREAKTNGLN